jgi:ABC-2 type transport system ATP-binding protein
MAAAVVVKNLRKSYGSSIAVQDVSFEVKAGEIFGLLGPNGAGKTTTIRCLCTLTKPDGGELEVAGVSVLKDPRSVRSKLGYIAQEVALDPVLTGRELLNLQAAIYHLPKAIANQRIEFLTSILGLTEYINKKSGGYSGGLKRRLDLAAGLLHQPEVLILDEPTVGLDIESRLVVWDFLRQLKSTGTTILLTSHYLEEVDALADRVGIIDAGKVIATGTPGELKDRLGGERITLRIREFTTSAEADSTKDLLMKLPFVQDAIINANQGNSLNLVVQASDDALSKVQATLKSAGLPVFGIAQSRPSLDDVYLAATGKTLMDAEMATAGSRNLKAEKKQSMKN